MADIAFLLIIFFMVTAVFSATKGLEFKLPKDDDKPPEQEEAVFIKVAGRLVGPRRLQADGVGRDPVLSRAQAPA